MRKFLLDKHPAVDDAGSHPDASVVVVKREEDPGVDISPPRRTSSRIKGMNIKKEKDADIGLDLGFESDLTELEDSGAEDTVCQDETKPVCSLFTAV